MDLLIFALIGVVIGLVIAIIAQRGKKPKILHEGLVHPPPYNAKLPPEYNEDWSHYSKLIWRTEDLYNKTGLRLRVSKLPEHTDHPSQKHYGLTFQKSTFGPFSYAGAWHFMNGIEITPVLQHNTKQKGSNA